MMQTALVELSSQHQLLERLETLTRFSSHIIFVHGDPGSGKTTLAKSLLDRCQFANQAWICVEPELSDSQIREPLLQQWLSDPLFNAEDPLWDSLSRNQQSAGGAQLLVVDQAELVSPQIYGELFELVEKYSEHYKDALNVVFFSSSRYRQLARDYNWQVTDVLELELEPLDEYESNLLAKQLFVRAQYQPSVANKQALAKLIEAAQGNPRAICQVVEQTISGAGIMSEEQNKARKPYLIWMIIAVIIAAVAGLAVQLLHSNDQLEAEKSVPLKPNSEIPVVLPSKNQSNDNSTSTAQVNSASSTDDGSLQKDDTAELPAPVADQTITNNGSPDVGQKRVVVDDKVVDELLKAQQGADANQQSDDNGSANSGMSSTQGKQAQDNSASSTQSMPANDTQSSDSNAQNTASTPASSGSSANTASSSSPVRSGAQAQDTESVLSAKAPNHYTLQLGAFSSMRAATDFVKQGRFSPAWVYPFQGSSQILYKVIMGDFSSRQQALTQKRKLKAKGQVSLLKSFRQVQFELKQS